MARGGDENMPEVLDAISVPARPSPRLRLSTIRDCRRELARVYAEVRAGTLEPQTGTRLAYLLQAMVGMIRDGDLEQRIAALEAASKENQR